MQKITVQTTVHSNIEKCWQCYTQPNHILKWNFATDTWHCPSASNDLRVGGTYKARMEAKDGSFGFDFEAIYSSIDLGKSFTYEFGGRQATVTFTELQSSETEVRIIFDAETENPVEIQQQGWQAILNNFKKYTEAN
jgi:uncharacterized protein YndB with AHSA1/START domain